jgi:hypothetical protein
MGKETAQLELVLARLRQRLDRLDRLAEAGVGHEPNGAVGAEARALRRERSRRQGDEAGVSRPRRRGPSLG